jgi:hypothetical protein
MIEIRDEIGPIEEYGSERPPRSDSERPPRSSPPIITEHPSSSSHGIDDDGHADPENTHDPPNEMREIVAAVNNDETPNAHTVQEVFCPCCGKKCVCIILSVNLVVGLIVGMVWQFGHTSSYFHEL